MAFNYNGIVKSVVAEGLEGKVIMIYGGNNLGKTFQSTKFPKSLTLPFEPKALNAIGDANVLPVHTFADFKNFTESVYKDKIAYEKTSDKLATSKLALEAKTDDKELIEKVEKLQAKVDKSPYVQFKGEVKTIIVDSLTALGKSAEKFACDEDNIAELYDTESGHAYTRFENDFYHTFNKFLNLGDFTYLILAHEDLKDTGRKDEDDNKIFQAYPKGNYKRVVKPVVDVCDIIVYLKSNGVDEETKLPKKSSGIMVECDLCFARTKWTNMDVYLPEYTAKNLEDTINKAIKEQQANGVTVTSHRKQQEEYVKTLTVSHEDLIEQIGELATMIYAYDDEDIDGENMIAYSEIVQEHLGDKKVSEATSRQVAPLKVILSKVQDLVAEREIK